MKVIRYLVIGKIPNRSPQVRVSVNYPSLDMYEIAVKVNLDIPDAVFKKPSLEASIKIPEDSVIPAEIDCKIADNIKAFVSEQLGFELNITGLESTHGDYVKE